MGNPIQFRMAVTHPRVLSACCSLLCASFLLNGCAERRRPRFAWKTAALVRPILPPALPASDGTADASTPDLKLELPPPPSTLAIVRNGPARPRVAAPQPPADTSKTDAVAIAPQLTSQESSAAQQETNANLTSAEKNLETVHGRNLNPVQADMVSKIRGFIDDARGAARGSDWTRARNLAKKAQLLSEELVKSL